MGVLLCSSRVLPPTRRQKGDAAEELCYAINSNRFPHLFGHFPAQSFIRSEIRRHNWGSERGKIWSVSCGLRLWIEGQLSVTHGDQEPLTTHPDGYIKPSLIMLCWMEHQWEMCIWVCFCSLTLLVLSSSFTLTQGYFGGSFKHKSMFSVAKRQSTMLAKCRLTQYGFQWQTFTRAGARNRFWEFIWKWVGNEII